MALKYKLSICGLITVVLTAIVPLFITFQHQKSSIENQLQEKLQAIVASSSQCIDGDLHNIIMKTESIDEFAQDEFDEIRSILESLKTRNKLKSAVYTMRPYDDWLGNLWRSEWTPLHCTGRLQEHQPLDLKTRPNFLRNFL